MQIYMRQADLILYLVDHMPLLTVKNKFSLGNNLQESQIYLDSYLMLRFSHNLFISKLWITCCQQNIPLLLWPVFFYLFSKSDCLKHWVSGIYIIFNLKIRSYCNECAWAVTESTWVIHSNKIWIPFSKLPLTI